MCWTNVTLTYNFQFHSQFVMSCNITYWDQMLTWLINVEKYEFINNITTLYHENDNNLAFIIVKLDTLLLKQKKLPILDITGFFFRVVQVIYTYWYLQYIYSIYTQKINIRHTNKNRNWYFLMACFFIIETLEKKLKKIKLAETLLYGPTQYIKVEDPFYMVPQKMKLEETLS